MTLPNFVPAQEAVARNTLGQFDQPEGEAHFHAGMDVCDCDGNKLGTISHVYRSDPDVIEVKTGPLGLGKHLWVPSTALEDGAAGCAYINTPKEHIDAQGWDTKPTHLP